jgi:hypothetical protein
MVGIQLMDISNTFSKMKCCALCGVVKLSHHNQHLKRNTYIISFYKNFNGIIIEYITNEIG